MNYGYKINYFTNFNSFVYTHIKPQKQRIQKKNIDTNTREFNTHTHRQQKQKQGSMILFGNDDDDDDNIKRIFYACGV